MNEFEHWADLVVGALGSVIAAMMGVLMKQAHLVQRGVPADWKMFAWNIPTIFVMGLGGHVANQYLYENYHTPALLGSFIAAWMGYLGPELVQRLAERWALGKKD